MFRGTLSLTQENHHFIVQIGKNKCSQCTKLPRTCITSYYTAHNNWFSRNSNILNFLLSPIRFTKCLGVHVPLRPPRKKALQISNEIQQCTVYFLYFTANLLHMFRVPFTPIISTGNCSHRPLVQVVCRDKLDGVASNPLKVLK
jgi:hypothetical protein